MQNDESKKLQSDPASGTALTPVRRQTVVDLDGFKDFTNEVEGAGGDDRVNTSARVIQGSKLKFNDPRWLIDGRDVTGMLLTVIGVRNVVNKWGPDNKPLITNVLPPGTKFPDFKKLNAEASRSEWRMAFGQLRGPWEGQHCLYLIDDNYSKYTWASPTTTIGSAICVEEVVDQINTVRKFRGPNVFVVAELSHKHFPNSYKADRERPFLLAKTQSRPRGRTAPGGRTPAHALGRNCGIAAAARRAGGRADRRANHARGRNERQGQVLTCRTVT